MDVCHVIYQECAFIDSLATDLNIIRDAAAKQGEVVNNSQGLADDAFHDGHLILPCGYWDRGETLADWFRRSCIGVSGNKVSDFDSGFVLPYIIGAEIKESPTS